MITLFTEEEFQKTNIHQRLNLRCELCGKSYSREKIVITRALEKKKGYNADYCCRKCLFYAKQLQDIIYQKFTKEQSPLTAYLLGYLWADGSFYTSKNGRKVSFAISSTINQDWYSIKKIFDKFKIRYQIKQIITKKGKWSKLVSESREGIIKFGNYIYKDSTDLRLERKKIKFDLIKNFEPLPFQGTKYNYCYCKDLLDYHLNGTMTRRMEIMHPELINYEYQIA